MTERVIVLVDMDCFYCQVEARLNPFLEGQPMAVVQYNQWKGGGIIAVNYEARDRGVTRHMRGAEAKKYCPEIILVTVPTVRDKADLTRYRDAGREVVSVLCRFSDCIQRASVDEAYIDLTKVTEERMKTISQFNADMWKSTFVVGYSEDGNNDERERKKGFKSWLKDCESMNNTASLKLAVGALIVEEMRQAVLLETGFKCSAGIAHNKILAKLACGLHKPNRQTVLHLEAVAELYKTLPVKKIRNLGGKFGEDIVEKLGCKTMSDLLKFTEKELQNRYDEKTGSWLYNIARGYDVEPVTARLVSKSIGCCKKFPGRSALIKTQDINHWLNKLAEELSERLLEDEAMNKRRANLLTISLHLEINKKDTASSRSVSMTSYETEKIVSTADLALRKVCKVDPATDIWYPPIKYLGLSAGKFTNSSNKISKFFKVSDNQESKVEDKLIAELNPSSETGCSVSCDESKTSFFERMFQQKISDSNKKLNMIPDLSRNDLYIDSDDSQGSIIKVAQENNNPNDTQKQQVVRKLFTFEDNSVKNTENGLNLSDLNKLDSKNTGKQFLTEQSGFSLKKNQTEKKTIVNFFSGTYKKEEWVKPEELFPDLSQIDNELLESLPSSYKTKIIELQKKHLINNNENIVHADQNKSTSSSPSDRNNESDNITAEGDILNKCDECGKLVTDYELHKDMHLAMKLDKELNSMPQRLPSTNNIVKTTKETKRKTQTIGKKNSKKLKSLDSFFKDKTH